MTEHFKIAIIGSGPGGMSAAGRAAEQGLSHILLERTDHLSDTIYKYQKGKHVMATPDILPLRCSVEFDADTREHILSTWNKAVDDLGINLRLNAEVTSLKGSKGAFEITLNAKETITADYVVLAIGLQGNLRKLGIDGDDWEGVQYQLDDPDEYDGENIVVVGAGDAAIENAVALAEFNSVSIINRRGEFARAKDGNQKLIMKAIETGAIRAYNETKPQEIVPGQLTLDTKSGLEAINCDRIIARLGAIPPRKFVEGCGIEFPSDDPLALPELSPQYESNVDGLFIIGALGGYPLIKQAMNQGYEVVELILGNPIKPADEPLLEEKFGSLGERFSVDQTIDWCRSNVDLISSLTTLQMRELLMDSQIHELGANETVFEAGEFGSTVFMIVEGSTLIHIGQADIKLEQGSFFGELAMVSAQPRLAKISTAEKCTLIETPRLTLIKLINSVASVKRHFREVSIARQLLAYLHNRIPPALLGEMIETTERLDFKPGEPLFQQGEKADSVFIIKSGSVTTSRKVGGRETLLRYIPAGRTIGELAVVAGSHRFSSARAASNVSANKITGSSFLAIMAAIPTFRQAVEQRLMDQFANDESMLADHDAGDLVQFLIHQGMGEATDILLIDEALCVSCNNCETACARTHNGISRLNRESGPSYGTMHMPLACRHCEDPYCLNDCPANAIHRSQGGKVYIDDKCIGCGNCERNCPYDSIHMSAPKKNGSGLLLNILFGRSIGQSSGSGGTAETDAPAPKLAVKCDACMDIKGGPSCVQACPTGAAFRVGAADFFTTSRLLK